MKRLLLILAVLVCAFIFWYFVVDSDQRKGEQAIRRIEEFRQIHHQLPNSLSEIGLPELEDGPIYYHKIDNQNYCIFYGTSLGESETYDSRTHAWTDIIDLCTISNPVK
jgi:hypothetical protein